ncbi:hypothetical protein GCM10023335_37360 [Streptomyces siamensis]|uniref:Uncharacterized protein n=1 Tax=Streptomyces siamensis TaxID=1274986 RepID=A0ABP9IZF1_9ACTN
MRPRKREIPSGVRPVDHGVRRVPADGARRRPSRPGRTPRGARKRGTGDPQPPEPNSADQDSPRERHTHRVRSGAGTPPEPTPGADPQDRPPGADSQDRPPGADSQDRPPGADSQGRPPGGRTRDGFRRRRPVRIPRHGSGCGGPDTVRRALVVGSPPSWPGTVARPPRPPPTVCPDHLGVALSAAHCGASSTERLRTEVGFR